MIVIPSHPYKTESRAEYRLFSKLQEIFVGEEDYIAFHSLNLTNHLSKRFSEADFVILCPLGLFVLEVKGGGVACNNGQWSASTQQQKFNIQDPFRQAQSALHALNDKIKNHFTEIRMPIGYGVIFPDTKWRVTGAEWDSGIICDQSKFRNIESWFKSFFRYWKNKPNNEQLLSSEQVQSIKAFIRPDFELIEPLYHRINKISEKRIELTNEQYKYLDIVAANRQVLCSGGAGTGKTLLASELVKRLAREDRSVVLVCKSSWLRYFLQSHICNRHVTISTIDSLAVDRKRSGVEVYDILIVDEGQDLFNNEAISRLESHLKGGLEHGEWYVFHDINNQSGLFERAEPEQLKRLESYSPANIPLTKNCRNTLPIINEIKATLSLDVGVDGTGYGPDVAVFQEKACQPSGELGTKLISLLEAGVSASSITILSPLSYSISALKYLPDSLQRNIIELDDYSIRQFPIENMSFAKIKSFKGLENEVILVIDLPVPQANALNQDKVLHYVSMTRASALLCLFWQPES